MKIWLRPGLQLVITAAICISNGRRHPERYWRRTRVKFVRVRCSGARTRKITEPLGAIRRLRMIRSGLVFQSLHNTKEVIMFHEDDENEEQDDGVYAEAPAGWIPPQFREFITEPVLDPAVLQGTYRIIDGDTGEERLPNAGDMLRVRRLLAVRDTRDGSMHNAGHGVPPMMVVDVNNDWED